MCLKTHECQIVIYPWLTCGNLPRRFPPPGRYQPAAKRGEQSCSTHCQGHRANRRRSCPKRGYPAEGYSRRGGQTLVRIGEVANSTREQSSASNDIAVQVEQIAQMVESTCTSMAAAAQTAERLDRLARELNNAVGRFRYRCPRNRGNNPGTARSIPPHAEYGAATQFLIKAASVSGKYLKPASRSRATA